jgi:peptidoglycan/LPS O-acetylase OafA/YrhL
MLQRIQTVYLALAFILLVIAGMANVFIQQLSQTVAAICFFVSALLSLVAIFTYRKRMRQIRLVALSQLAIILGYAAVVCIPLIQKGPSVEIGLNLCPAIIAFIFEILARKGIIHDEKLVRSADRIR